MLRRWIVLAALLVAVSALPASAQGSGAYIGGSVGASTLSDDLEDIDLDTNSPVTWKAFAGYSIGRFIALEGGYNDFGTHEFGSDALTQDSWGVSGFGILKLNLGPIDIFGKLGMVYASATTNVVGAQLPEVTGTGAAYGGGLAVNLGKLGLRAEAEWFDVEEANKPFTVTGGVTLRF
jgi:hypothetical protein